MSVWEMSTTTRHLKIHFYDCCSNILGSTLGQCFWNGCNWTDCPLENDKKRNVCVFADDLPKKKPPALYKPTNPDGLAYLDFSVSTTGMLAGVQVSSALILIAQPSPLTASRSTAWTHLPPPLIYSLLFPLIWEILLSVPQQTSHSVVEYIQETLHVVNIRDSA